MKLQRRSRQRGASMIEVLVSIVIASIGLLGMAGISAASLKYAKLSQYRATASQLATGMAERMRANGANLNNLVNYQYTASFADQGALGSAPPMCSTALDNCSPQELAAADLWQWRAMARELLPAGSVTLVPDTLSPGAADLWVAWLDPSLPSGAEIVRTGGARECPLTLTVTDLPDVRCLHLRVRL
jgi:type IV pilus assembly protein PilV